jgi:hypothetical protein
MLDKAMVRIKEPRDVFTEEYAPDQAVTGSKLVNAKGKNLHVLFPPWHGGGWAYERLVRRLAGKGDAVLAYYFHDDILKPGSDQVAASFENIRDTVAGELDRIAGTGAYGRITLKAMSLGNPALSMVTSKFNDFDSATLVVGASSLARSVWHGVRTRHIRVGIDAEGHDLDYLEKRWSDLAPMNHVDSLIGKQVTLLVSTADNIIPTDYQEELVDAIQAADIDAGVHRTRLGHYAAIGRFCMYGSS